MHIAQQNLFPLAGAVYLEGGGTSLHFARFVRRRVRKPLFTGPNLPVILVTSEPLTGWRPDSCPAGPSLYLDLGFVKLKLIYIFSKYVNVISDTL